ncbi:hypothetical protein HRbin12_01168 [bacterium HR12]|nr:hypothetical protein HRbin12_01168 [bacterium HR12]GIU98679.1 MAG: hypothetical protein KatS3mg014_0295 [Actinomycetota bacterium]
MVRRAFVPALVVLPVAGALGALLGGAGASASAALGVAVVYGNFAAHGLSLAWASGISIAAVQATALLGPVVRLGAILGLMFALDRLAWFSPVAFGGAVVPGTLLLLAYEARLAIRGLGGMLEIPPDPVAARAGRARSEREAR